MTKPNPGSKEALERSCSCPVLDRSDAEGGKIV